MFSLDVTQLIQWLVAAVLVAGFAWLGVQVAVGVKNLKLDPLTKKMVDEFVESAVNAAEQAFLKDDAATGQSKYDYAAQLVHALLEAKGIKYDEVVIDGLIESKVYELFNYARDVFNADPVEPVTK
jgi:hypothetical protein